MLRRNGSAREGFDRMVARLNTAHIRLEHRRYDSCPRTVESVVNDDTYSLLAPVRCSDVRVISDGHVLVESEVRPGMLRFIAPGERVRVSIRSPSEHIILLIPGPDIRKILESEDPPAGGRKSYIDPLMRPDRFVAQAVAAALRTEDFDVAHRQLYIDGLAHMMLARLLAARTNRNASQKKVDSNTLSDQQFDRCCQYADAMMEKKLCLGPWASVFNMTTTEFTKSFRQRTHESPYAWFLNRRIERAKTLLQDRKAKLTEVAFSVGFCSQSHFTEAFRRRVGCSPARWRAEACAGFR
jgi:AraC-like DNA-binding protein